METELLNKNIYFEVRKSHNKLMNLVNIIEYNENSKMVIFCNNDTFVYNIENILKTLGYKVGIYCSSMSETERLKNIKNFEKSINSFIVVTKGFELVYLNKDIDIVLHINMISSLEDYYKQSVCLCKTDKLCKCILIYENKDILDLKNSIKDKYKLKNIKELRKNYNQEFEDIGKMIVYGITDSCLRNYIMDSLNDRYFNRCNNCSNCLKNSNKIDITNESINILKCIKDFSENYTIGGIINILRGIEDVTMNLRYNFNFMYEREPIYIRTIIYTLIDEECISYGKNMNLKLLPLAYKTMNGDKKIFFNETEGNKLFVNYGVGKRGLLKRLERCRQKIAIDLKKSELSILKDDILVEIAKKRPRNINELLEIKGIGKVKAEKYGNLILEVVNNNEYFLNFYH